MCGGQIAVEGINKIETVVAMDADVTIVLIQATELAIITKLPGYHTDEDVEVREVVVCLPLLS
jgi:hypothetical protein